MDFELNYLAVLKTIHHIVNEENGKISILQTNKLNNERILYSIKRKYFQVINLKLYINSLEDKIHVACCAIQHKNNLLSRKKPFQFFVSIFVPKRCNSIFHNKSSLRIFLLLKCRSSIFTAVNIFAFL